MSSKSGIMGISARNQPKQPVNDYESLKGMESIAENRMGFVDVSVSFHQMPTRYISTNGRQCTSFMNHVLDICNT
jgi:hypothetical protein